MREAGAARGARAAPAAVPRGASSRPREKLSAEPAQDRTSGCTRGREGTVAVPPSREHHGARRVPGWERGKPCSETEPQHGAGEGGESPLFFLGAEYCANSGKWDFSPQPQCREERGWREERGAQTYQAWNTERRKKTGRSLADMVRTALAR